jgi:hypothetical protein
LIGIFKILSIKIYQKMPAKVNKIVKKRAAKYSPPANVSPNRTYFSISASLKLGDLGRSKKSQQVKEMYSQALKLMNQGNYQNAYELLQEILIKDRTYTPAKTSLQYCKKQIDIEDDLNLIIKNKSLK